MRIKGKEGSFYTYEMDNSFKKTTKGDCFSCNWERMERVSSVVSRGITKKAQKAN